MIPNKIRESRRVKSLKLPKNLEHLYKKEKCRDCAVVITRMDFAKILGKFTKVKIQYENTKTKQNSGVSSPNTNARLKSNENGKIFHRNSYSQHPVKELTTPKKTKSESPRVTQVLKENNRLKKSNAAALKKDNIANYNEKNNTTASGQKQYVVVFEDPIPNNNNNKEVNNKVSLSDLLSQINDSILPSKDWCIDFFPKKGEPKDDKVYDRIAAELEDLMYSEKPKLNEKMDTAEAKVDDFPSIMDILNDNSSDSKVTDQSSSLEFKSNLESSDVEAMLLGKTDSLSTPLTPTPMDVDNSDMGNLLEDVNQLAVIPGNIALPDPPTKLPAPDIIEEVENPQSPSILDEALQKGIEEHLPCSIDKKDDLSQDSTVTTEETLNNNIEKKEDIVMKPIEAIIEQKITEPKDVKQTETISLATIEGITHLVFKMTKNGTCLKSVTCPKNLKYDVEIEGKSVEFIGAPKLISNPGDLQILLAIVNESELSNVHVLH